MKAAQKFMQEAKTKPARVLEPIPEIQAVPVIKYSRSQDRDPYQKIVVRNLNDNLAPDTHRKKDVLETYSLDSLKMMGTIVQNGKAYAIIATPDNLVFSAAIGDYLGQNYGRISSISPDKINVEESLKINGEWQKRKVALSLTQEDESTKNQTSATSTNKK